MSIVNLSSAPVAPLCISCLADQVILDNGTNIYNVKFQIAEQPINQGNSKYNINNIKPGMWFSNANGGMAWRIININIIDKFIFTADIEDVEYYNISLATDVGGAAIIRGVGYIFELCEDGLPNLVPIFSFISTVAVNNLLGRFINRNLYKYYIPVNQASHNLNTGDIIYLDSIQYKYYKISAITKSANKALGIVTCTNNNYYDENGTLVSRPDYFSYRPFGQYITKNTNINLQGQPGTIFYLDINGNFTSDITLSYSKPIYIVINNNYDLILLNDSYDECKNKTYKITIYCKNSALSKFTVDDPINFMFNVKEGDLKSSPKEIDILINNNFILPNSINIWGRRFNTSINDYTSVLVPNTGGLTIEATNTVFSMKAYSYSNLLALLGISNPPASTVDYIASEIYLNIYN